jgi:hypothetical protein
VFPVPQPATPRGSIVREGAPLRTAKGTWEQTWVVVSLPAEQKAELLVAAKAERLAELAATRWAKETGGIVRNGMTISTDRESQGLVNGALALVSADITRVIDWKGANGWIQLDAGTVQIIAFQVGAHVQGCFTRERQLAELIEAATDFTTLDSIDLTTGWPA